MAGKEDLDLDLSDDEEAPSGGSKKKLIIILIVVVLFGAGIGYFFLFRGNTVEDKVEEEPVQEAPDANTLYFKMPNPVDANIAGGKKGRLLQIRVAFQVKSIEAEDAVKKNLAIIKNKILMKLQLLDGDKLGTREAKEQLKQEILEQLQEELTTRTGKPHIEKILFTSFVMQ